MDGLNFSTDYTECLSITNAGLVGVGKGVPVVGLDVLSGILHVGGQVNPPTPNQGAYLGWNQTITGETDFINNPGFGTGGRAFMATP